MGLGALTISIINRATRRYAIVTARLQTGTFILRSTTCAQSSNDVMTSINYLERIGANETGKRFIEDLPRFEAKS
jgi:hypothetical protein